MYLPLEKIYILISFFIFALFVYLQVALCDRILCIDVASDYLFITHLSLILIVYYYYY